jgi:hypothetical protein
LAGTGVVAAIKSSSPVTVVVSYDSKWDSGYTGKISIYNLYARASGRIGVHKGSQNWQKLYRDQSKIWGKSRANRLIQ